MSRVGERVDAKTERRGDLWVMIIHPGTLARENEERDSQRPLGAVGRTVHGTEAPFLRPLPQCKNLFRAPVLLFLGRVHAL